ncbi:hypothetical protein QJS10_CPB04g00742 [Acorus calamus]|uniref:Uncharacterized protein n=1 Tax=Acorus calamus TaxID=4465 RepID=A0AAV9F4L5_ACOCL|nr:hypothetical protein QJS10_CPB04g00742 [Acorus calamus]
MPSSLVNKGKWEEPCHLFVPTGENSMTMNEEESNPSTYSSLESVRQTSVKSKSCPSFGSDTCSAGSVPSKLAFSGSGNKPSSFSYMWGSSMESHKWNRRRILALRKESSREFEYVSRYLEAEQIGAVVREQEKRAARKTAHLHYLRKSEEQKHQRNLQVEKMKSEMLNLQIQLHSMSTGPNLRNAPPESGSLRRRRHSPNCDKSTSIPDNENIELENQNHIKNTEVLFPFDVIVPCKRNDDPTSQLGIEKHDSPLSGRSESPSVIENMEYSEITEVDDGDDSPLPNARDKPKVKARENPLISAVQMIGDGVSQVQSLEIRLFTTL